MGKSSLKTIIRIDDNHSEISKVKEIVELHPLFGDYDLIAKVVEDDPPHEPARNNEPDNPVHGQLT